MVQKVSVTNIVKTNGFGDTYDFAVGERLAVGAVDGDADLDRLARRRRVVGLRDAQWRKKAIFDGRRRHKSFCQSIASKRARRERVQKVAQSIWTLSVLIFTSPSANDASFTSTLVDICTDMSIKNRTQHKSNNNRQPNRHAAWRAEIECGRHRNRRRQLARAANQPKHRRFNSIRTRKQRRLGLLVTTVDQCCRDTAAT